MEWDGSRRRARCRPTRPSRPAAPIPGHFQRPASTRTTASFTGASCTGRSWCNRKGVGSGTTRWIRRFGSHRRVPLPTPHSPFFAVPLFPPPSGSRPMRCALLLAAVLAVPLAAQQPLPPIRGFPRDALAAEVRLEQTLRAVPNRDTLRAQMRDLSAIPHEAGTERSRAVARTVELVGPERFVAQLKEPALPDDPTSGQTDQLPTFNAYSPDGDATGELVYVNYGIPEDYHVLDSLGISVKGKIVIARYGNSWRGIKPKVAAEHGAIGCLIYSDPRDDGFFEDDIYPKGPMRPWQGVQRGSVMDMPIHPGDPLSPGWASVAGGQRLTLAEATTIEKIPVLPISYGDAMPLLRNLSGPVAPERWRGALPITYHIGGGPARVHLAVSFDWKTRPLYDVIATIRGSTDPDQWVIYG